MQKKIREYIGDFKFCIIVDKACDEFNKEHMILVLKFVDNDGFIQKHLFGLVHVKDIQVLTLKNEISIIFFCYNFII